MDARTFLGLEPTADPLLWRLPVTLGVSTPGQFLFGGAGLAAGVAAMEIASGRPTIWATAQYLAYAPTGSVVDFDINLAVVGHQTTQARAIGRVAGKEILAVNAALGRRQLDVGGTWAQRPDVAGPDACTHRSIPPEFTGTVLERVEMRLALGRQFEELDGTPGDGRCAFWARLPGAQSAEPSSAWLSILGDYVPSGVAQALGRPSIGNSLDNTIRVVQLVASEWVLCDIQILAIANGFGHGRAHLWAEDGTLLGVASQSVIVRVGRPPLPRPSLPDA
ncbi:MAG TPA: acyl-CoA thioesterase [Acidimicrobiales bacterium]|nr:acyl-CoA thioesterase [Acidimicrobiales bacterium]